MQERQRHELPTQLAALEDSVGCFTSAPGRTTDDIADRHLRGELGAVVDARRRDAAHVHGAARRRLPERPVPQRHPRRGHQGAGARPERPRARGGDRARRVLPAVASRPPCASRCAATTTRGPSTAGSAELEFEKSLGENVRVMVRGRLYEQSGRGLLERRLHRRRPAPRPARAVLDRRPRALALLELARRRCASSGRLAPAEQAPPRLHRELQARRLVQRRGLLLRRSTPSAASPCRTRSPTSRR